MAKVAYGIKTRPYQKTAVGILNIEDMSIEMADEGTDTITGVFEEFNGKLVKITFEEVPQE